MEPDAVHRLELSTGWNPDHVAAYLVEGDEGIVLVDAGVPGDDGEEELRAEFGKAGYSLEDTDFLLVTHPHTDHDGQFRTVVEQSGATVYAYEEVPEGLRAEGLEEHSYENAREAGVEDESLIESRIEAVLRNRELLPPDEIDVLVGDGETFEVAGHTFEALHTPGHQAEHLAYACDNLLFSGDALIESFRPAIYGVGFEDGMYDSVGRFYETFERLGERDAVERVYPGHGPVFEDTRNAAAKSTESLDSLVEDVYETVASFDDRDPTAFEVAVSRKEPHHDLNHTIFDNIGALGYLDAQDRLVSYLEDGVRRYRAEAPA